MNIELIIEAYHATFRNRNIIYKRVGFREYGISFTIKSVAYLASLILKILLAPFCPPLKTNQALFVAWNPLHKKLAARIGQTENLVGLDNSFSVKQLSLYRGISLVKAFRVARTVISVDPNRHRTGFDNYFFCVAFIIECQMLEALTLHTQHILMAGQADRYAIILAIIAREKKKYFSFVQHGVNNVYEGLYLLRVDEVYYLFEISIPLFGVFVEDAETRKYIPIPSVRPNFKPNPRYTNAIAFASCILAGDAELLEVVVNNYTAGDVLIYPHPTEKDLTVYEKYKSRPNVYITMERVSNIRYLISCGSTLGLEYDLIGVPPVFVNTENFHSEIFHSDKFIKFDDIASFRTWFLKNVTKQES